MISPAEFYINGKISMGFAKLTSYTYDGIGNALTVFSNGVTTRYVYDNLGQARFIIDGEGFVSENVYDAFGQIVKTRQYSAKTDVTDFSESNMQAWVSNQVNPAVTQWSYNELGQVRFTIDPEGFVTENIYDDVGNLVETKQFDSLTVGEEYVKSYLSAANNIDDFTVYDNSPAGAVVESVLDEDKNINVIQVTGDGVDNSFRLMSSGDTDWNNSTESILSWDGKFSSDFRVAITVQTEDGVRYLRYMIGDSEPDINGAFITHYLSADHIDGNWHTIERDLVADLAAIEPDNVLLEVDNFIVRGSGRLDNIELKGPLDEPNLSQLVRGYTGNVVSNRYFYDSLNRVQFSVDANGYISESIYDANSNVIETKQYDFTLAEADITSYLNAADNIDNFSIYDNSPPANISSFFDSEKQTNVIQLAGAATANGYELTGASGASWNNSSQFNLSVDLKYNENLAIAISVDTNQGHRWIKYAIGESAPTISGSSITHYVSADLINGNWQTLQRNLVEDLQALEPDNQIIDINSFRIRGSGLIDNVQLSKPLDTAAVAQKVIDASPDYQSSRFVYDEVNQLRFVIDAEGYVSESIYDANGQVIQTKAYFDKYEEVSGEDTSIGAAEANEGWIMASPLSDQHSVEFDNELNTDVHVFDGYGFSLTLNDPQGGPLQVSQSILNWDMKQTDDFKLSVDVNLLSGESITVSYEGNLTGAPFRSGNTIHIPLPELADGEWHQISRNLENDIAAFEPNAKFVSINNLYVEGNGRLNDIRLVSNETSSIENFYSNKESIGSHVFYDALGQARFSMNAEGFITETRFDANGNVVETRQYQNAYVANDLTFDAIDTWSQSETSLIETRFALDNLGQVRFTIDAEGYVTENIYNDNSRLIQVKQYESQFSFTSGDLTVQEVLDVLSGGTGGTPGNPGTPGDNSNTSLITFDGTDTSLYTINDYGTTDIAVVNEELQIGRAYYGAIEVPPSMYVNDRFQPSEFTSIQYEFSTPAIFTDGHFIGGLDNALENGDYGFKVELNGSQINVIETIGFSSTTTSLGTASANTTYVVEFESGADTLTVYVYEQGSARESGFTHSINYSDNDWGNQTGLNFYSVATWDSTTASINIDNISISKPAPAGNPGTPSTDQGVLSLSTRMT